MVRSEVPPPISIGKCWRKRRIDEALQRRQLAEHSETTHSGRCTAIRNRPTSKTRPRLTVESLAASPSRFPGELIWTLRKEHIRWACELKFHGEGVGSEVVVLRDAELSISRRFTLREQAIAWADAERHRIEVGEY